MSGGTNLKASLVMAVFLLVMAGTAAGGVIYVDADASPGGDGTTWGTAYKYLQDGLADANVSGDDIWVAEGTYNPDDDDANDPNGSGLRTATFQLINGVALYGGFAGGESIRDERDWQTNETVLSGEIGVAGNSDNSYHVVTGSGTDANAVLDGFTITAGNANVGGTNNHGGGMYNVLGSSPRVTNCTFSGNSAILSGGGIYNSGSDPALTNCTFSGNSALDGGGIYNLNFSSPTVTNCTFSGNSANNGSGGGMWNYNNSNPTVTNCTFSGNSADGGGGMFNEGSSPALSNCTFSGNSAGVIGGGMINFSSSSPTITNCTFSGNSANSYGGGMSNGFNSSPTVTNCTFSGNLVVDDGGGMYNYLSSGPTLTNCTFSGNTADANGGGMYNKSTSSPTLTNCILWDNTAASGAQIYNSSSTPTVTYSDIAGGYAGTGNINADPLFVDADGDDNIAGTADDNLRLLSYSPCIDAGDNTAVPIDITTDLDGSPRFFDDPNVPDTGFGDPPLVDMGPYEHNIPSGGGVCGDAYHPYPPGDLSGPDGIRDCKVNFYDIAFVAGHWLECTAPECD